MEKQVRFNIWFAILAVFGILFLQELWVQYRTVAPIAYSEFVAQLKEGNVGLGYTLQRPTEDRYLMTGGELSDKMAVLLGGRAAEQLVFAEVSTGAADDLAKVTDIARSMVTRYGMHGNLGHIVYEEPRRAFLDVPGLEAQARNYSEDTARAIDEPVRQLVDAAFAHSRQLLEARRAALEAGAKRLLEKETLTDVDLRQLLREVEAVPAPSAGADGERSETGGRP